MAGRGSLPPCSPAGLWLCVLTVFLEGIEVAWLWREGTELVARGWAPTASHQLCDLQPPATEPQFPQLTGQGVVVGAELKHHSGLFQLSGRSSFCLSELVSETPLGDLLAQPTCALRVSSPLWLAAGHSTPLNMGSRDWAAALVA